MLLNYIFNLITLMTLTITLLYGLFNLEFRLAMGGCMILGLLSIFLIDDVFIELWVVNF